MPRNTILINHRKSLGISQPKMAEMLGIPLRTYQSIEYRATESAENMYKIMLFINKQNEPETLYDIVGEVDKYLSKNPTATWMEIWKNVPNNYRSSQALKNSYNSVFRNMTSNKVKMKERSFKEIAALKGSLPWKDVFAFDNFGYKNVATMKKCYNEWRRSR